MYLINRPVLGYLLLLWSSLVSSAAEGPSSAWNASLPRWEWQPKCKPFIDNGDKGKYLNLSSGIDTWYTVFGKKNSQKTPVLLLHGGQGNANQMYNQANALAKTRQVILQDTRGQGRSPYKGFKDFHYDDFTRDAMALLDHLKIPKVAAVGWSDGAITALDLAMNYSSRIERVFAHGANLQANMSNPGLNDPIINSQSGGLESNFKTNGVTYSTRQKREASDPYSCEAISPTPKKCKTMEDEVSKMWNREPTWTPATMLKVKCPTWIVDGDHDIAVQRNQADALAAWIPFAGQLLFPQTGHFALLEDPIFFNFALEYFLDMNFDGPRPYY